MAAVAILGLPSDLGVNTGKLLEGLFWEIHFMLRSMQ